MSCAGYGVERIDPLHFLAGCRKRRLNQARSVLSLSLGFSSVSVVLLTRATFWVVLFCIMVVLVSCKWLAGKTRFWNDLQCVDGDG